ncbi:hypothetical protein LQW54_011256 [Pestalotiopsis sp. IQ-011]
MTRNDNRLQNLEIIHVKRHRSNENEPLWRYRLAVHLGSQYGRLVIVTKHTNEKNWQVFLGESTVVNALLNKPLEAGSKESQHSAMLGVTLQALVCAQWATAIGSAATKGWDAYAISFWVLFSIFSHKFLFTGNLIARLWLAQGAKIDIYRYRTQLSSRRASLSTILALNPDTFSKDGNGRLLDRIDEQALKCIDPILEKSRDRDSWQEASRLALMQQVKAPDASSGERNKTPADSQELEKTYGHNYWYKYIEEGVNMAIKIGQVAQVPTAVDPYESFEKHSLSPKG